MHRVSCVCAVLALFAAMALAGCAPTSDVQQLQGSDSTLRGMIASDRQQMNDLQEQVSRLNDRLAEMEHNGDAGGRPRSVKSRLARLENEVAAIKAGSSAPAAGPMAPGAPGTPGAGGAPEVSGAPSGPSAPPPGAVPSSGVSSPMSSAPAPAADVAPATASAATAAAGATSNDNADTGDDNSADSGETGAEVASSAPPPSAAPPPVPAPPAGPPMIAGSPSWRAVLSQELASSQSSGDSAVKVYRAGLADMKAAKYQNAIGKFQGLQRKYPKSSLSEPAEYFSANALYELGKYDQSILQFNDLVMRFPKGRFASASLLSEAQAFMKMNDRIDARLTLQKLLGDHPDSREAPSARAMMNSLANG